MLIHSLTVVSLWDVLQNCINMKVRIIVLLRKYIFKCIKILNTQKQNVAAKETKENLVQKNSFFFLKSSSYSFLLLHLFHSKNLIILFTHFCCFSLSMCFSSLCFLFFFCLTPVLSRVLILILEDEKSLLVACFIIRLTNQLAAGQLNNMFFL